MSRVFVIMALLVAASMPAFAQTAAVDQWTAIQQVQTDVRADRQALVAANLTLTATESPAFWPIYKEYTAAMATVGERRAKLIMAYASNYNMMDDAKAETFLTEWLTIEKDRGAVREKFVPRFKTVLPASKVARFFQIDNKIDAIINLGLAEEIPLVPLKK